MKTTLKNLIFFLIFSILIFFFLFNCENKPFCKEEKLQQGNFSITISLDKQEYLEGEYIWVNVIVKNNSSEKDSILHLSEQTLSEQFKIIGENNKKIGYHGLHPDYVGFGYNKFEPFEEKKCDLNITWCYGTKIFEGSVILTADYFPEDKYSIYIELKSIDNSILPIKSNTITFKVTKPKGNDLNAYQDLIKVFQTPYNFESTNKLKSQIDNEQEFVKKYPKNAYTERIMELLISNRQISKYKYDNSFISDGITFLDNFPDSRLASFIIYNSIGIMKSSKSYNEISNFLSGISDKYKGTRTEISINKFLKEFNDIPKF